MMCDTNWCTFCDNAISPYSNSLYCSEDCLRQDALMHHPMLGYDYAEFKGFPHPQSSENMTLPPLVRRKLSIPSLVQESQRSTSPSSLSSSISSCTSHPCYSKPAEFSCYPKSRKLSTASYMEQLNQAF